MNYRDFKLTFFIKSLFIFILPLIIYAHGITGADQEFLSNNPGVHFIPYLYLGAKHMVTGYDHLLFLAGVIFFLYKIKDVAIYVTLFAIGHSATLLLGVLSGINVNVYLIDAIIGFSVVYKAFENIGGFNNLPFRPNTKVAVFIFGLFHGFGLSSKLQDIALSPEGIIYNMIGFNIGVEIGQFIALAFILLFFNYWRQTESFNKHANNGNYFLMIAGFLLITFQLSGYYLLS
jgi:hypothetical protein